MQSWVDNSNKYVCVCVWPFICPVIICVTLCLCVHRCAVCWSSHCHQQYVHESVCVCVSVCIPVSICFVCVSICLCVLYNTEATSCTLSVSLSLSLAILSIQPSVSHRAGLSAVKYSYSSPLLNTLALHIYEAGCRPPVLDGSAAFFCRDSASPPSIPPIPPSSRLQGDLCEIYFTVAAKWATVKSGRSFPPIIDRRTRRWWAHEVSLPPDWSPHVREINFNERIWFETRVSGL